MEPCSAPAPRQRGRIRMYNPSKGWGFVTAPAGSSLTGDIFLHAKHFAFAEQVPNEYIGHRGSSSLRGHPSGQTKVPVVELSYNLDLSDAKRPQALNVLLESYVRGDGMQVVDVELTKAIAGSSTSTSDNKNKNYTTTSTPHYSSTTPPWGAAGSSSAASG
ncbi:unnamed protein product, partial [Amoebophrya sp. A25]|eukprot:GSA25T00024172001.1